jgi:heme-degrading monooxygenase HmoA
MSQILETIWVKSAAYGANPAEIDTKVFSEFGKIDGVVARYKGTNVAQPDEHVWVIIWNSKEQLQTFVTTKAAELTAPFRALADSPPSFANIVIPADSQHDKALNSPVVSFSFATPKEGITQSVIAPIVEKLVQYQNEAKVSRGYVSGKVEDKPNTLLSVSGWDSVEAHQAAVSSDKVSAVLTEFRGYLSELEIKDVKLVPFTQ